MPAVGVDRRRARRSAWVGVAGRARSRVAPPSAPAAGAAAAERAASLIGRPEPHGLEVGPELAGVLVAGVAVLGERVQHDGVEVAGDAAVDPDATAAAAARRTCW